MLAAPGSGLTCRHGSVCLEVFHSSGPCLQKRDAIYPGCTHAAGASHKLPGGRGQGIAMSVALTMVASVTSTRNRLAYRSSIGPGCHGELHEQPTNTRWGSDSKLLLLLKREVRPPHLYCTPQNGGTHPLSQGFRLEARITKSWGLVLPLKAGLTTW